MKYQDSVYGTINLPDKYKAYLETRPLIRLRNVKQLGFTPSVYTGAVHNRYEHTIGKTWILSKLLAQFQIDDKDLINRYMISSIFSEIGSFPFSHSTNWLFSTKLGASKTHFQEKLFNNFIRSQLALTDGDKDIVLGRKEEDVDILKSKVPSLNVFPELNILKLAGDIDYSLRDAHYTGRYSNGFDLRYFQSLTDLSSSQCIEGLTESVRELYRSIYALHSVYGDKTRRFITLIFTRLTEFLSQHNYLDTSELLDVSKYIDLDDDKFMAILRNASERAVKDGIHWIGEMLNSIEQLHSVNILELPLNDQLLGKSIDELETIIADKEGVDKNCVIAINDNKANILGYRLFNKTFKSYSEAINSSYFTLMTGLSKGSDKTGLLNEEVIFYIIINQD